MGGFLRVLLGVSLLAFVGLAITSTPIAQEELTADSAAPTGEAPEAPDNLDPDDDDDGATRTRAGAWTLVTAERASVLAAIATPSARDEHDPLLRPPRG